MRGGHRDLSLKRRKEDVRDKCPVHTGSAVRFDLATIQRHFQETLATIRKMFDVADELDRNAQYEERDTTWRGQIVFLAGAFDFFMHEITKYGLVQIMRGAWERTSKYKNLAISMEVVELGLQADPDDVTWFHDYVNTYYSTCTMISHTEVKEQLNLLGIDCASLAKTVFYQEGDTTPERDKLKDKLNQLFDRRNIIAHQVDRSHKDANLLPIEKSKVSELIAAVDSIVRCICDMSRQKDQGSP